MPEQDPPTCPLTRETLRLWANPESFSKGERYYQDNAVLDACWQDGQLTAMVRGSRPDPYGVQIRFDSHGVGKAYCSCLYHTPGQCKHIVAVLLTCIDHPETITKRRSLQEVLRGLDMNRHLQLWDTILKEDPSLARKLEMILAREISAVTPSQPTQTRQPMIDPAMFRREAMAITASLDGRYDYGMGDMIYDRLHELLDRIQPLLDADDGFSALAALRTIMESFTIEWLECDEESESLILYDDMGAMIAEALLRADLTVHERNEWLEELLEWHNELANYGYEAGLAVAIQAAKEGWETTELQAILRGDAILSDQKEAEPGDPLARIRLKILAQRGRHDERLKLAYFYGEYGECTQTLFHLGLLDEAEQVALTRTTSPAEMQTLAILFYERGDMERALRIAKRGLTQTNASGMPQLNLARWLRDTAQAAGDHPLALYASTEAFIGHGEINDYQTIEMLAKEEWPTIREQLLERMALEQNHWFSVDKKIAIYLREGRVAQAVALAEQKSFLSDDMLQVVMRAAIGTHSEWVIRRSRAEAEAIMDAAKANAYHVASEWLALTRNAYLQAGRQSEWASVLASLIQKHARKYKLKPMLEQLR